MPRLPPPLHEVEWGGGIASVVYLPPLTTQKYSPLGFRVCLFLFVISLNVFSPSKSYGLRLRIQVLFWSYLVLSSPIWSSLVLSGLPGASSGLLGSPGASWGLPGASWGLLGPPGASWGLPGASWGLPGASLGPPGVKKVSFWAQSSSFELVSGWI